MGKVQIIPGNSSRKKGAFEAASMEKPERQPLPEPATDADQDLSEETHVVTPAPHSDDSGENDLGSTRVLSNDEEQDLSSSDLVRAKEAVKKKKRTISRIGKEITKIGDFQIIRKLGEGAMGAVYQAYQQGFNRNVALKVLFPHIAKNQKLVTRLHREGRVMGQLDHPNIVQGYGVYEDEKRGWHYVAMELIEGESLQKWLGKIGKLSVADSIAVTIACAQGLGHAHELGIIHRDIKPDNVLVTKKGDVKVTDLGMVKTADEDMSLTQTGHAVGTPWYMPLEQAKNAKETDARCDIYALGCMLYCMLTGNPPFTGQTIVQVIQAKEQGTFPPARTGNPEVPEKLDLIIVKMTAKHPKYRYQSCAELIRDLEGLGLASEQLTFVKKNKKAEQPAEADSTALTATVTGSLTEARVDRNVWYLQIKNAQGKTTSRKITTAEIHRMISEGLLKATTQISHRPDEGFRSLATFKEFQGTVLERASKKATKPQSAQYKSLYNKIEQTEIEREKKDAESATTFGYWFPLVAQVAAALVGLYMAYYFIKFIANGLGGDM